MNVHQILVVLILDAALLGDKRFASVCHNTKERRQTYPAKCPKILAVHHLAVQTHSVLY